jgi:arylsulfatase A-like enzyme
MTVSGKPMNLLVLMTDQQRTDTLGCLGATPCRTPNLDRVAAEGVAFSHAITPVPLCSPARASIITGRYPHSHRCLDNCIQPEGGSTTGLPGLDPSETALSELLAPAGVACGYSGKWHLGRETERQRGFELFTSHRDPSYLQGLRSRGLDWDEMGVFQDLHYREGAPLCGKSPLPAGENRDAFVARNAMTMLDRLAGKRPFALWCSFYGPHQPFSVPEPWDRMYDPDQVELPETFGDEMAGRPPHVIYKRSVDRAEKLDEAGWRRVIAHYWGYVSFLDSLFGRLLDRVRDLGLWDSTAVVMVADHGEMLGDHRMFCKGLYFYDGIMRAPLIVRVPGIAGGRVDRGLVSLTDVAPTALDAMGLPVPPGIQGRSLLPAMRRGVSAGQEAVFAEHHGRPCGDGRMLAGRMIRTTGHKYCMYTDGQEELYDLAADPHEQRNLAGSAGAEELRRALRRRLEDWMAATGDFYPEVPEELVIGSA